MRKSFVLFGCAAALICNEVNADPLRFQEPARWAQVPITTPAGNATYLVFGKVNADAMADLLLYNTQRGEAYVALSNGHGFGTPSLFASGLPTWQGQPFDVGLADVNGDGLDDLVILNKGPDDVPGAATALVALSTGHSFAYPPNPVWNPSWCANYQTCLFGDLNGDRRADMTAFTPDFGTLWGSLSLGTKFGDNSVWHNFFCIRDEVCALGDVDGDGKADAIAFKPRAPGVQKGNVLVARSNGTAFTDVRLGHGFFCIDGERCLVGDVNGDRRADIVLVKGWGSGAPTLEVLVSLSNGQTFINATPFQWARPPFFNPAEKTFGSFMLADVTGDGKADLIEYGITSAPISGGGSRTTGWAVDVFVTTDKPPAGPSAPPTKPPQPGGFSAVHVYNCHPDQNRLYFWNFDNTAGTSSQIGPIDAMYSETGFCPDPSDSPQSLSLVNGHIHTIVAVDPLAIGCEGRNDPSIVGCVNNAASFRGSSAGPACNWIVSAQAPFCGGSLGTSSLNPTLGPTTCISGFVWRVARPSDLVCVTPEIREQTAEENRLAAQRRAPAGGPFGPATCLSGFVWRGAFDGDVVCVLPGSRDQAQADNAAAPSRVVQ